MSRPVLELPPNGIAFGTKVSTVDRAVRIWFMTSTTLQLLRPSWLVMSVGTNFPVLFGQTLILEWGKRNIRSNKSFLSSDYTWEVCVSYIISSTHTTTLWRGALFCWWGNRYMERLINLLMVTQLQMTEVEFKLTYAWLQSLRSELDIPKEVKFTIYTPSFCFLYPSFTRFHNTMRKGLCSMPVSSTNP